VIKAFYIKYVSALLKEKVLGNLISTPPNKKINNYNTFQSSNSFYTYSTLNKTTSYNTVRICGGWNYDS